VGFTERVLSEQPATIEHIKANLKERFSLIVAEDDLQEILGDLVEMKRAERFQEKYKNSE